MLKKKKILPEFVAKYYRFYQCNTPTKKNLSEAKKLLTFYFRPTTKRCTGCDNRIASLWKAILLSHSVVFQGSVSGVYFTLSAFCKF